MSNAGGNDGFERDLKRMYINTTTSGLNGIDTALSDSDHEITRPSSGLLGKLLHDALCVDTRSDPNPRKQNKIVFQVKRQVLVLNC